MDDSSSSFTKPNSFSQTLTSSQEKKSPHFTSSKRTFSQFNGKERITDDLFKLPSSSSSFNGSKSLSKPTTSSSHLSFHQTIFVNENQKGNPLLSFFMTFKWEFSSTLIPDYQFSSTSAIFFLSLQYHKLHPTYIHHRTSTCKSLFHLRILLVLVDVVDYHSTLLELTKFGLLNMLTIITAKSFEECAKYIELYKSNEGKSLHSLIPKKGPTSLMDQQRKFLGNIQGINKTDVLTLMSTFKNLKAIAEATPLQLNMCPGLGSKKVNHLKYILTKPFRMKKGKNEVPLSKGVGVEKEKEKEREDEGNDKKEAEKEEVVSG